MLLIGIAPNAYADFTGPPMGAIVGMGVLILVVIFLFFFALFRLVRFVQRERGKRYPKHVWFQSLLMLFLTFIITYGDFEDGFEIKEYVSLRETVQTGLGENINTFIFFFLMSSAFLISGAIGSALTPKLGKNEIE